MIEASAGAATIARDFGSRRQAALEHIQDLIARAESRAARAWRNYYLLQGLTIGLAAITPCLIFLAKDNPNNEVVNWLQLFFPALAALTAGLTHIFRFREDAVRSTTLGEAIRSQLWRFSTRAGEFSPTLTDDQVLDRLVTQVDELNLKSLAQWTSMVLAEATPPPAAKPAVATAEH